MTARNVKLRMYVLMTKLYPKDVHLDMIVFENHSIQDFTKCLHLKLQLVNLSCFNYHRKHNNAIYKDVARYT